MFYVNSQEELDLSSPEAACILKRMGRKTNEATKCNGTKSDTTAKSSNICKENFNWMDTSKGGQQLGCIPIGKGVAFLLLIFGNFDRQEGE